ncbi:MAG: hypothetical protein ACYC1Q_07740 [Bacteroidia bacterium]
MPQSINKVIREKFAGLRYRLTIRTLDKSKGKLILGIVEVPDMGGEERFEKLLEYYFLEHERLDDHFFIVHGDHFSIDGHGREGICRQCGCVAMDACDDQFTGCCFWVEEDLCSACATPAQIQEAMDDLAVYMEGADE